MKGFEQVIPWIIFGESLAAAIAYLVAKDFRHAYYWLFAAGITATVTWK